MPDKHSPTRGQPVRAIAWLALVLLTGPLLGCIGSGLLIIPVSAQRELDETTILRDAWWARDKIAVIDVSGIMRNQRGNQLLSPAEHPVSLLREQLDRARRDATVQAVVLRINSPGGTVTASELMHDEVQAFRAATGKPVVAIIMDVGASGGYYLACACDEIVAHRTSVTGSIGVIIQLVEFSGTMRTLGISATAITSGPNKDAGSPFTELTSEERAIFQGIVDDFYARFLEVVAAGRPGLSEERLREAADGRVFTAPQALDLGLIDRIGTIRDALAVAKRRAGVDEARVVVYHRSYEYEPNYYAQSPHAPPAAGQSVNIILPELPSLGSAQFMYLWQPGR